jgi:hypothetical protein
MPGAVDNGAWVAEENKQSTKALEELTFKSKLSVSEDNAAVTCKKKAGEEEQAQHQGVVEAPSQQDR